MMFIAARYEQSSSGGVGEGLGDQPQGDGTRSPLREMSPEFIAAVKLKTGKEFRLRECHPNETWG